MIALNAIMTALVAFTTLTNAFPLVNAGLAASPDTERATLTACKDNAAALNITGVDSTIATAVPDSGVPPSRPLPAVPSLPTSKPNDHHDHVAPHGHPSQGTYKPSHGNNSTEADGGDDSDWDSGSDDQTHHSSPDAHHSAKPVDGEGSGRGSDDDEKGKDQWDGDDGYSSPSDDRNAGHDADEDYGDYPTDEPEPSQGS
ncbi:hypothetical protein EIP86_006040 [Pleurotus ostreatoroseus]|nr:hypothetical protein EIP86_006040 [Pleurotus ostreatoroseus]